MVCVTILKQYGVAILSIVVGLIMIPLVIANGNEITKLEQGINENKETIKGLSSQLSKMADFDEEQETKIIKENTISATKTAEKLIKLDKELADMLYETNFTGKDWAKRYAQLEEENRKLKVIDESKNRLVWRMNPEWSLTLESVLAYQDTDEFPVVFSMMTKDKKTAGLVYAEYNVEKDRFENISLYYTNDGIIDEASMGGR